MQNNFFIIIITFNGKEWLEQCLKATESYPVIVVDNNSTDGTVDLIEKNYPEVVLLSQKENLGFGRANNIGISYAVKKGADQVLLLNQDAYLEPGCIANLIAAQKAFPKYGILSPIHLNGRGDQLDYNFRNFLRRSRYSFLDRMFLKRDSMPEILDIEFVNAACWLISKDCLKRVGGFNPFFFHYGEDRDYINRAFYYKFKVGIVSNVYVNHDRNQRDSKRKNEQIERLLTEVNLLDVNKDLSVNQYLYRLRKNMLVDLTRLNIKKYKRNKALYSHFLHRKKDIEYYKRLLTSKKEFLFLNNS